MARKRKKTEIIELFNGYYAEDTEDGLFVVKQKGILRSPHEYSYLEPLSNHAYAFYRAKDRRVDVLLSNSDWYLGLWEAYTLFQSNNKGGVAIIVLHDDNGTTIISDDGLVSFGFEGYRHLSVIENRLIAVYDPDPPGPYIRVYNTKGDLVTEGYLREAEEYAIKWRPSQQKEK